MKITDIKNVTAETTPQNYETIFNIYTDENAFYYFNILKKIDFPNDLDSEVYDYYETLPIDTYPNLAFRFYGTVVLWWLICAANQIDNPIQQPQAGTLLKIIKPYYVQSVLAKMNQNE